MSRFKKLTHTIWHCQYHVVWIPEYRYRILDGRIRDAAYEGISSICGYAGCDVADGMQSDHVHLIVMVAPKLAISDLMGRVKGQTAIKVFKQLRHLTEKPHWGNHSWSDGYCVDTPGLAEEMIRKYAQFQAQKEHYCGQLKLDI